MTSGRVASASGRAAPTPGRADGTTVLGLQSRWTFAALAGFWAANVVLAVVSGCIGRPWCYGAAVVLMAAALVIGYLVPGDRLPLPVALLLAASTPAITVTGILGVHSDNPGMAYYFITQGVSIILGWICLRGRGVATLVGSILCTGVIGWASMDEVIEREQLLRGFVNGVAVVVVGVVFTVTVGHAARRIHRLRVRTLAEVSARAAQSAIRVERDAQLARLDTLARPMLRRVASGVRLDDADSTRAMLIEGQLRDQMRAPAFDMPDVSRAVRLARLRGVAVTLLDDSVSDDLAGIAWIGAIDQVEAERCGRSGMRRAGSGRRIGGPPRAAHWNDDQWNRTVERVRSTVVDELAHAQAGSAVTVRLLPRSRPVIATMLVSDGVQVVHREFTASDGS